MSNNIIHLPITQEAPFDIFDGRFFEHPLVDHFIYDGKGGKKPNPFLPVWVWMIATANESPNDQPGDLTTSEAFICKTWGISPQDVADWLDALEAAKLIWRYPETASITINALFDHLTGGRG